MKSFPRAVLGALAALLVADTAAHAAWNNVFQVSFFHRRRTTPACCQQPVVAVPAAPVVAVPAAPVVAQASPCQQCTTQYVQRSYYQPVTTMTTRTYYEPVTSYKTSYYYEPVTSYRYSCYYDPCSCSYQQVATPTTSYRLRSKCDPVTSYLQRTQCVPTTSYKLSYYYEPQTTCCQTTVGAPVAAIPQGAAVVAPQGGQIVPVPQAGVPGVGENPGAGGQPRPGVGESPGVPQGSNSFRFRETPPPPMGGAGDSSRRQETPKAPAYNPPPKVRLDRIVALPGHNIEGSVVQADYRTPRAGARLLFVSAKREGGDLTATADQQGHFRATLPAGGWLVYVRNREGTPVFQKRIELKDSEVRQVSLSINR
jgi:hypothetical protein